MHLFDAYTPPDPLLTCQQLFEPGFTDQIDAANGPIEADTSSGNITICNATAAVHADTSDCRTEVEITTTTGRVNRNIDLNTVGGDIALRVSSNF